ncbi:DUF6498-containing protein [Ferruginibacter sp.]|nr:hypothetical protein [Ferruginibacter sp.]
MNKGINLALIIIFNLVPIFGVAFYNWQPFEAFWFFWVETLVIAIFNTIRIVFSQGQPATAVNTQRPLVYHINKGIKYLFIRIAIFFFYAIFIIVFVGFVANTSKDKGTVLGTILLQNQFFNVGLLISFSSQCYYLITGFLKNGSYLTASPDEYAAIFDGRQLVIHVAIVLGALGSMFLTKQTALGNYGNIFIISLLCICKCFFDIADSNTTGYKTAAE